MAAVKGVNVTLHDAGGQGDNAISEGYVNSTVEVWCDSYEASALASGSTIEIAELPAGAKHLSTVVTHDALGTGVTLAIGDSDTAGRYLAATAAATAGKLESAVTDGVQYVIGTATGDGTVLLTTGGASATGTIKTIVYFTRGAS
jgi:hypothetical protein